MTRINPISQHHMLLGSFGCVQYHDLCLSQLTTEAKPASLADQEEKVVSFWAKPYRQKLQALPAPNKFSTMWSAFQTPQGNLGNEVEFDKHGPLLNIYRPQSAKVWPNRRWSLCDSLHADLPCAEHPAIIVVTRTLRIQRQQQLTGNYCMYCLAYFLVQFATYMKLHGITACLSSVRGSGTNHSSSNLAQGATVCVLDCSVHAEGPACSICKCSLWHLLGPEAHR